MHFYPLHGWHSVSFIKNPSAHFTQTELESEQSWQFVWLHGTHSVLLRKYPLEHDVHELIFDEAQVLQLLPQATQVPTLSANPERHFVHTPAAVQAKHSKGHLMT